MSELSPDEQKTLAAYQNGGQLWSSQRSSYDLYRAELKEYAKLVPFGHILDIGSGNGRDAKLLTEDGYVVDGIDISSTLLEVAQAACPNANFSLGSMYDLPYANDLFDEVWMVASLLHIPREKALLPIQEARRVIKQGGGLFLTVKQGNGQAVVCQGGLDERLFVYWQEQPLRDLLAQGGFETVSVRERIIGDQSWLLVWATAV